MFNLGYCECTEDSDFCANWFTPSDLSSMYSSFDIYSNTTFNLNHSAYDLMIQLQMSAGKSDVTCATFHDYANDAGQSRTHSDSGGSGSNSSDTIIY